MMTPEEMKIVEDCEKQIKAINAEWRNIENYPGYQVSNLGYVRSNRIGQKWKILNPEVCKGYKRILLRNSEGKKHWFVHILVARAFIANPDNKPIVNHKDADKFNNCVENLEWATPSENTVHAFQNGLMNIPRGTRHYLSKLTDKQVAYIRKVYVPRDKKFGEVALARKFGISLNAMSNILCNRTYRI